jgi:hypothetical protein
MRFKNLLGLLAIGGAVAYAQKKRGGELSLDGFKKSFRGLADSVKAKLDGATGIGAAAGTREIDKSASAGSTSVGAEYASGYSSNYGATDRKY